MASSPLLLTALLFGASLGATAQTEVTWAAVSYIFHGEKTPDIVASTYNLTTIGAHQLQSAGEDLRTRYVSGNSSNSTPTHPIQGLNSNSLDNSQLFILSTDDEYVAASAQAFMQGLYPPVGATGQGNQILGNGSLEMYPLNGYQYAGISTVSTMDYNYIWISGNIGCTNYEISHAEYLYSTESENLYENSLSFYASLESSIFWPWDASVVNYENAYALYEYALYESIHNGTVLNTLSDADLSTLYNYASTQQFAMNSGNTNASGSIAGATLAAKVIEMFGHNIASAGVSDKLTLLFGSFEPFLSFFSLSGLSTEPQYNTQFTTLPLHGSLMTFELYSISDTSSASTSFPPTDELHVRFAFRNGTDDSAHLRSYPLFGRGLSQTEMTYADFMNGMSNFAMTDAATWCTTCGSITLFCEAFASDSTYISTGPSKSSKQMKPWVAGIIGAVVTLAVGILVGIALAVLGGARIGFQRRKSSLGGFKGAEKMQSDADLPKTGAGATTVRHERVGSWELSDADKKRDAGMDRVVSGADYSRRSEDGIGNINPFGDGVKALDQV